MLENNFKDIRKENSLNKKDLKAFAENLAVSFKDYPLFEYFANYKYKPSKMYSFWKVSLKTLSKESIFVSDCEDVNSLAIFTPYEKGGVSIWEYIKAGGLKMIPRIGLGTVNRMTKFEKFADKIKDKYCHSKCWYLYVFVTLPELRNHGYGKKIMKPMLEYLDQRGEDCYLETLIPLNVEIYKKFGFELMEVVDVPNTDLTVYALLRKAKTNNKGEESNE